MRDLILKKQKEKRKAIYGNFLDKTLNKSHKIELESAVGIVFNEKNELLVGLAIADDERSGKWCFPGGGIDGDDEDCLSAAIREVYEETGILTTPMTTMIFIHPTKPMVGFCCLKAEGDQKFEKNEEFKELKWVGLNKLPEGLLELNKDILKHINTEM